MNGPRTPAVPQLPGDDSRVLPGAAEPDLATDALIEEWFIHTFHNIGLGTEAYNRFYRAKDELKARIRAALTK